MMGLLAAFVGYASSFAIILAGLTAMGASSSEAASGLFFATLGMGVCGIWIALSTGTPAAVAWSTPGAAFLASTAALPGGFAEATGAFIFTACLILVTGFVPALNRCVAAIPKPVASALLAGVILNLCFRPALALGSIPLMVLPVLVAWLIGLRWHRLAAMPCAVLAFALVWLVAADGNASSATSHWLPVLEFNAPVFTWQSFVSVSVPLYIVTMAGQNIPGFAVLELHNYTINRARLLGQTGAVSLLIAPLGAVPVNMSAITAAMMCGEDAGPEPAHRYWAAVTCGLAFIAIAFASSGLLHIATQLPTLMITAVAGLALIPALVASTGSAFSNDQQTEAPALTFLIAASGMTLFGISGAFWGVAAGVIVWMVKQRQVSR